LFEEKHKLAT